MDIDRNWMSASRLSEVYEAGAKEFIRFAVEHAEDPSRIICPCTHCCFLNRENEDGLLDHLIRFGIDPNYTCWTKHGELGDASRNRASTTRDDSFDVGKDSYEVDCLEDMVDVVAEDLRDCPEMFERIKNDADTPLYDGCSKFTRLSTVLKLYNLKAGNGWSDKSFSELLSLIKEMLPNNNVLPCRTYEAKKMLCSIGLSYEKIHACPNDCLLFRNEFKDLKVCPKCNGSRYKNEKTPAKVMWYFPIIPRFRRLFSNGEDAKHLVWHEYERRKDGKLRHPADSPQWSKVNREYPDFGQEPRNLRLALSTDGMNPHGIQSSTHSTWPVILMIYNLPPWLCVKRKYMMLSILKLLWDTGVEVYDRHRHESFKLRAMLFGTINDFPAYGNLSGYSIKGKCACPICDEDTCWERLDNCKKNVFLGHRRFLGLRHHYRTWVKAFNGKTEEETAPLPLSGEQLLEKVENLSINFGKPFAKDISTSGWKKKSIFFELPYWKSLHVRHFLDVMPIEKNVCDSVIGTLLNVPGKTKDGIKARLDMVAWGIREELQPIQKGKRTFLPPAAYTLSRKEKISFCKFLQGVKVPEGYSSNIRSLVSMKDLKLIGLKTHDCHVLMENLLPVAIQGILPTNVRATLTRLCMFFKAICSKVIDPAKLPSLQQKIVLTLCELEMYFPPSFFDIMIHLTVHLVKEVQLCGPCYMRWMYPTERYMKILKGYVKNRGRLEGCIVERYIVEEAVEFCSEYLANVDTTGVPQSRHTGRTDGEGLGAVTITNLSRSQWEQAHLYVLHNTPEIDVYVELHKGELRRGNPMKNENWIEIQHNKLFISWFRDHILQAMQNDVGSVSEQVRWLARGPKFQVLSYSSYLINGYKFYTKDQDDRSTMQNSGVTLVAEALHITSSKDRNPRFAPMSYFGVIQHIWEFDYTTFRIPIFSCKWVDNKNGVHQDVSGFMLVDLNRVGYKDEPFILASQAKQVFFVNDPADDKWSVVLLTNKDCFDPCNDNEDISEDDPFVGREYQGDIGGDHELYMRDDHLDGIWINIPFQSKKSQTRKRKRVT